MFAIAGAMALAGCEQHPYPTPAPDESAPPPQPPSQLMGAPQGAGGPPPPPAGYAPPSAYGPGAPPMGRAPCAPDPDAVGPNAPTVIICSTPVPNPPEREGHAAYGAGHHHHHHHWRVAHTRSHHHRHWGWSAAQAHPRASKPSHRLHHHVRVHGLVGPVSHPVRHPHHRHHGWMAAPVAPAPHHLIHHPHAAPPAHVAPPAYVAPVKPAAPARTHHHAHVAKPVAPKVTPKPVKPTPIKPSAPSKSVTSTTVANTAASNSVGGASPSPSPSPIPSVTNQTGAGANAVGTVADRYDALQSALASVVARDGKLDAPAHFPAGQSTEVSLTLPADFGQTLQTDAAQQGLADAAASVNMTSGLSGDGYTVAPDQPQSQPLTLGQATVFRWKVTPQANAQTTGPLQATLNADLLSQGRSLPLGTLKSASPSRSAGRVIGLGLLVVIAAVVLGWALRRRRPAATGASKPRANHQNGPN